jgi:hypothetical protein
MKGGSLLRAFERKENFIIWGNFMRDSRDMQKGPVNGFLFP